VELDTDRFQNQCRDAPCYDNPRVENMKKFIRARQKKKRRKKVIVANRKNVTKILINLESSSLHSTKHERLKLTSASASLHDTKLDTSVTRRAPLQTTTTTRTLK